MKKRKYYKCVLWCDPAGENEHMRDNLESIINDELKVNKIGYKIKILLTLEFPKESFDILFFDYGGLSVYNNTEFRDGCKNLLKHAEDHPSKFYVLWSSVTQWAIEDMLEWTGKDKPANLLYELEELYPYLIHEWNLKWDT